MNAEPTIQTNTDTGDDVERDLVAVEAQVNALLDPTAAVDAIIASLEDLHDDGATLDPLTTIQGATECLLEVAQEQNRAFRTTLGLARKLKEQRDQTHEALDELKYAVETADTLDPTVAQLWEAVEEMISETNEIWLFDMVWETIRDELACNSPLTYREADRLVDIFLGEVLPDDHPLWNEVREWLARADDYTPEN
jgi:sugar/nucleoside kinase (ribokinase family)